MVLLLLTFCLLLLPLWESVTVLCFVVRYFMSILALQSSWWGRESWLLYLICLPGVSWWLSSSSSRYHGVVCGLWLLYFLIILTYYFFIIYGAGEARIGNCSFWLKQSIIEPFPSLLWESIYQHIYVEWTFPSLSFGRVFHCFKVVFS